MKKVHFAILATVAIATTAICVYLLRPTPERIAAKGVDCVASSNGQCVYDLMTEEERRAYGMTPEQINQVFAEIISPNLQPADSRTEILAFNGSVQASRAALTPSGQRTEIAASGMKLKEGIKSPVLLGMAFLSASMSEKETGTGAELKFKCQKAFIQRHRARLEELGMKGLYRSPDEGLMTWDQWIARCDAGIQQAASTSGSNAR